MLGRVLEGLLWLGLGLSAAAAPALREAPNPSATPANQLAVAGNACGPAALLNSFRFGNPDWQRALDAVGGGNDREQILKLIREIGMRPSKHVPGHPRWSRRGVSLLDLRDMANEMTAGKYLPQVSDEVFFLGSRETPEKLLQRVHRRFDTSLSKGLPPVLSLRRYVLRGQSGKNPEWVVLDAHFVTITGIPRKLEKNARSFSVNYIDPWGGKHLQGIIGIPAAAVLADPSGNPSCLEAVFPQTPVAKKRVLKGEQTVLAVSAAIGRW
jgi:hypothetical protein